MKSKYYLVACAAIALSVPVAASAAGNTGALSYNYIGGQIGYSDFDIDGGGNADGLALGLDGSAALLPNINLVGSYNHGFLDDADMDLLSLGAGAHTQLSVDTNFRLDAFGNVTYEYIKINPDGASSGDENGIGVRGGLRAKFQPNLEVNGSVGYVDYGSQDGPVFKFGGVYSLPTNPNVGLTLTYEHQNFDDFDVDQVLAGVRMNIN